MPEIFRSSQHLIHARQPPVRLLVEALHIDAKQLGIRYPMEVNLAGDARDTLDALIPLLERKADRSWRERIEAEVEDWWTLLAERAEIAAEPLNPEKVFHALSPRGAMQMNGISALIDVVKHRHRWSDPCFVVLVVNNGDLNQVRWEQRVLAGDPKLEASQVIPDFPYARYAELLGLKGIRVEAPGEVAAAWDEALASGGPVVVEAVTDPEVPPLPPLITLEQARARPRRSGAARDHPPGGQVAG